MYVNFVWPFRSHLALQRDRYPLALDGRGEAADEFDFEGDLRFGDDLLGVVDEAAARQHEDALAADKNVGV